MLNRLFSKGNSVAEVFALFSVLLMSIALCGCPLDGEIKIEVPDVTNQSQASAEAAITGTNLTVGAVTMEYSSEIKEGNVIRQNPDAGKLVLPRNSVSIVVSTGPRQKTVPNVVGKTEAEAETSIRGAGLTVGTAAAVFSSLPEGNVISQEPEEGEEVDPGTAVNLTISKGIGPVSIPFLVGQSESTAMTSITDVELVVGEVTHSFNDDVAEGLVISQNPESGTTLLVGETIDIVISDGIAPIKVPDVAGQTQADAESAITALGLVVDAVTFDFSNDVPEGSVISQDPVAGTGKAPGGKVDLVISKGPEPLSVPDVVEQTQGEAIISITDVGLVAGDITQAFSETIAEGSVIIQNPLAETETLPGTSVDLVISSGKAPDLTVTPATIVLTETETSATLTISNASDNELQWTVVSGDERLTLSQNSYTGNSIDITVDADVFTEEYTTQLTFTNGDVETDEEVVSVIVVSTIVPEEMISIPTGTFEMENLGAVTLSSYEIGKFEVTNGEYAEVLNWALEHGYLQGDDGEAYVSGNVLFNNEILIESSFATSQIEFSDGQFSAKSRDGESMANYPVVQVTWYGAVMYCNWLSESQGLSPCYIPFDPNVLGAIPAWVRIDPLPNGYRLPTEAEWERAASWDGTEHWDYAFSGDTIDETRCNYNLNNPLDFSDIPFTTSVGYYNGSNSGTIYSVSPVGAYDMSGNVQELCHDVSDNYPEPPVTDPSGGPVGGRFIIVRGGGTLSTGEECQTAPVPRLSFRRTMSFHDLGFRIARTP